MDKESEAVALAPCSEATLDLEFAYTPWRGSCRNIYTIDQLCRRPGGHDGEHAAGFGLARVRWH